MSRNMRWLTIAGVVVIALVVVSCATPTPPQAEVECFEDSDCPEGQKCADGECVDCTQNSDCCELFPEQVSYCDTDRGKCVAVGCETPADCKEVCPTGNWDCRRGVCLEPLECFINADCCDLHPGEVWKCDDDNHCVKVGCDTPQDCEDICPTGNWVCEKPFGDCVKATPTPESDCTEDADCDDGECVDGECVEAEPTPTPMPEEEQVLPHILAEVCGFVGPENRFQNQNAFLGVLIGDDLSEEYCFLPPEERDHKLHGEDWNFIATVPVRADHTFCFTDVPDGVDVRAFTNMVVGDDGGLVSINAGPLINTEGGGFFEGGNAANPVVSCH